jgi:hypothetical protein
VDAVTKRRPAGYDEEVALLRDRIETVAMRGGSDTMMSRIAKAFKLKDVERKNYLTAAQLIDMLGDGGCRVGRALRSVSLGMPHVAACSHFPLSRCLCVSQAASACH